MGDDLLGVHGVMLSAYLIDRTEVTVNAYARCVRAGACSAIQDERSNSARGGRGGDHPVNYVTWTEADAYCRWSNQRLPTEAEWEYAARGTDGRTYPWGNQRPSDRLLRWNSRGTAPVGSYPAGASPFGALDMAGNVWEWTADRYGPYSSAAQRDPTGPDRGELRVVRGGGWSRSAPAVVHCAVRYWRAPPVRDSNLGFRCARGLPWRR